MKHRKKSKSKKKSFLKIFFRYILYSFFSGIVVVICIFLYFSKDLPDLKNLKTEIRTPGVVIQTYDGKIIGSYGDLYEDVIKVESLPKYVPAAFMAIEDRRFFQHFGIDFIGFFRAIYQNFISKKVVQGGSTITQQLAKNILIAEGIVTHYDRSIGRKIKELLLAFWLEYKFSKADIMMMYLNRVYFGAGTYGIDAASRKYFNKPAKKLSIFESAILAGLLKAPSKYSPSNHKNYAYERAMIVLNAMEQQGYIKNAKAVADKEGEVAFTKSSKPKENYMYFCDYAYDQAEKILGEIEDDIIIVTTFDEKKQNYANEALNYYIKTEKDNFKFSQVAFICIGRDGGIQALIGGDGYFATQFNRATQAQRMSGSAFKIFIYGAALEYGYQLNDMISDEPVVIDNWKPRNYKWKTRGELSVLDGFTYSVNAVSIRLAQSIGLKRISDFAKKLGIYDVSTHNLSVALGTTLVSLKDLTAAYSTFMDGYQVWPYCITEIRAKSGKILFHKEKEKNISILDKEVLKNCRTLLNNVIQNGTGRAAKVNDNIYGKTGSNGDSDAWFIGFYDPSLLEKKEKSFSIGVWIGNDRNDVKMAPNSTGGRIPARIASMFMKSTINPNKDKITIEDKNKPEKEEKIKSLGELLA